MKQGHRSHTFVLFKAQNKYERVLIESSTRIYLANNRPGTAHEGVITKPIERQRNISVWI